MFELIGLQKGRAANWLQRKINNRGPQ